MSTAKSGITYLKKADKPAVKVCHRPMVSQIMQGVLSQAEQLPLLDAGFTVAASRLTSLISASASGSSTLGGSDKAALLFRKLVTTSGSIGPCPLLSHSRHFQKHSRVSESLFLPRIEAQGQQAA